MESKEKKIFLTYTLGGKYLIQRGEYTSATISRSSKDTQYDCGIIGKETIIEKPSFQKKAPKYAEATQKVTLGESFVEMALTKPECPYKHGTDEFYAWLRSPMGQFFKNFKNMSDEQKIEYHVNLYVKDMSGEEYSYQIV